MKVTPGTVKARTIAINQPPTEDECTCGCRQVKTPKVPAVARFGARSRVGRQLDRNLQMNDDQCEECGWEKRNCACRY